MKKILEKIPLFAPALLLALFVARSVSAQSGGGTPPPPPTLTLINFPNPLAAGTNSLIGFVNLIITNVIIPVGAVISVFFIIFAGFLFVTARGNPAKLETAKKSLLYAAIGAAVLLGSQAIATAIQGTINQIVSGS